MFYKQLEENKTQFEIQLTEQRKQSRLDKFESQFYEILRLHKENVNELELKAFRRIIDCKSYLEKVRIDKDKV